MGSARPHTWPRAWFSVTLGVLISTAGAGCYLVGQQSGRSGVDDVPRAMAARAAQQLSRGMAPAQVVGTSSVDLVSDHTPFVIVYDQDDHVVVSGATLAGEPPTLPSGVLTAAAATGENHVTWQPLAGVREAVVALPWRDGPSSGVVVAGASLQPAEARSRALLGLLAVVWLVVMSAVTLLAVRARGRGLTVGRRPHA